MVSKKQPRELPPLDDLEALARHAHSRGLGSERQPVGEPVAGPPPAPNAAPAVAKKPKPRPKRDVAIRIAQALHHHLKVEAAQRDVTVTYLVLEALKGAGHPVEEADMVEDGRRLR